MYDGSNSFGMPTAGKLTGERDMLHWQETEPPSFTNPSYRDVRYGYDTWGNRTTVTAYPGEGTSSAPNTANAQVTTTNYDANYHTYPVANTNALLQIERAKYDYALGLPVVVTDTNGIPTFATYDAFGRMTGLRRDGDASSTLAFSYTIPTAPFSNNPFYTQVTQRVNATTTFSTRKYYNGLGQLLQTEAMGASVNGAPRDILVDTFYDASGRVESQSVPYDKPTSNSYHGRDAYQPATETSYDPLDRVVEITAPDETQTMYTYAITLTNDAALRRDERDRCQWAQHPHLERRLGAGQGGDPANRSGGELRL